MGSELALMAARLTLTAAAEQAAGMPVEERRRRMFQALQSRDLDAVWALVLSHLVLYGRRGAQISPGTIAQYRGAVTAFWTWAEPAGVTLTRPHADVGRAYLRHLEGSGKRHSTVVWHLAAVKALYEALRWCHVTEADPWRDVRPVADRVPRHLKGRLYSADQVDALLAVANPEEAVAVLLGADCGLRAAEIMGLQRQQFRLNEEPPVVTVVGKGAKTREVGLSRRAEKAVHRWLEMTPRWGPALFGATSTDWVQDTLRRLCEAAGIEHTGRAVHGLRRTAGTRLYEETKDLLETRDFLGHRNANTTEVYVAYAAQRKKPANRDW
ncbi:tyrosine-type recombinase/integrase [Deinococcus arboris]|nr:tyrosine-type recombinase/integrase [Deinococcus arboris]